MVRKQQNTLRTADSPESPAQRRGRPPSQRSVDYLWYRDVDGFDSGVQTPWWDEIKWEEEEKNRRASRSFKPPDADSTPIQAGFLWETARRFPELRKLIETFDLLRGRDLEGRDLVAEGMSPDAALAEIAARNQATAAFDKACGMLVYNAVRVLCENWKESFTSLEGDAKEEWISSYQALWYEIGIGGTVPALPVEFPDEGPDVGKSYGQGITAFDLLKDAQGGGSSPASDFIDQPLPTVSLKSFAELSASEGQNDGTGKFGRAESYPWVSFGILRNRLKPHQLHPLVLAINLAKDNESIVRDLMKIVQWKRRFLGLDVPRRRIRRESFEKIGALDREVLGNDGKCPLASTVKEFENAAQLDLQPLIDAMNGHLGSGSGSNEEAEKSKHFFGLLTGRQIPDPIASLENYPTRTQQRMDVLGRIKAVIQTRKSWEDVEKLLQELEGLL